MQFTDTLQVRANEADTLEKILVRLAESGPYNGLVSFTRGEEQTLSFGTPKIADVQIVIFTVTIKSLQVIFLAATMMALEMGKEARNG